MDADERETDGSYTRTERDEINTTVEAVDVARDVFIAACADAATRYSQAVEAANPRFVSKFSKTFVDDIRGVIADAASDHLDAQEMDRARAIVEVGHD